MIIDVVTIFPELFVPFFTASILGIAQEKGLVTCRAHDLRTYTEDRHGKVDDKPFGGGPGMVFTPQPVFSAVEAIRGASPEPLKLLMMTPQGERFTQNTAQELAREAGLLILAGHYEGFDERIRLGLEPQEISVGDYVLTGGELPAMTVIDAVIRLVPDVLGCPDSGKTDSFARNRLGFPQYSRPRTYRDMEVPEVLLSGDHGKIAQWRETKALERTCDRRPDLLKGSTDETG